MIGHDWVLGAIVFLLALAAAFAAMALFSSSRAQRAEAVAEALLRTRQAAPPLPPGVATAAEAASGPRAWFASVMQYFEQVGTRFEGSRLERLLIAPEDRLLLGLANWNTRAGTAAFLGLRLVTALLVVALALALLPLEGAAGLLMLVGAFALGILLPKIALGIWAGRLRRQAYDELPLLIDLLRLLQGVGFSIDQSLHMLGDKLRPALPLLGRELRDANALYSRGRSRAQSLQRLSDVYDDDDLRSLMQIVLQVHAHGGAVQEPLKQFSARLREQRRMEMKEKIGKLSVKMTVVMMLTLLPALMLVLSGPAIIALAGAVSGLRQ